MHKVQIIFIIARVIVLQSASLLTPPAPLDMLMRLLDHYSSSMVVEFRALIALRFFKWLYIICLDSSHHVALGGDGYDSLSISLFLSLSLSLDHHSLACLLSGVREFFVQALCGHNSLAAINILAAVAFESANVANDRP
mmetsp:Transcript_65108/g.102549  ORF Transcript_65108/g.102549 Transcript_65108/m.102549 type:complete len:139 (+) Transcript_65108:1388-1804(+)